MTDTLARMRLMILIMLLLSMAGVWILPKMEEEERNPELFVSFLNIGQGDAVFIETASGVQILIDGGPTSAILRELAEVMDIFDTHIDIVVGTHPDKDHIGGLVDVLNRYNVDTIITTENESESAVFQAFKDAVAAEEADVILARRGQIVTLDASTTLEILFPENNPKDMESNASSIVLRLTYGESSFLFTGDSPKRIEEYLVLAEGEYLKSDVLKIGHHGSRTSTSEIFLDEVHPTYAVISAGRDNSYGHPHVEVTDTLFNAGVRILNTAEVGRITFVSDGEGIQVK